MNTFKNFEPVVGAPTLKFYHFSQNNSGGGFDVDDVVAHHVIIEADSADQANQRAIELAGIYFNGCDSGRDCDCCGDRWSSAWGDEGEDTPLIYGEDPIEINDMFTKVGEPYCHVYFLDGSKRTYYKGTK